MSTGKTNPSLTCDSEAVGGAGVREGVGRSLVLVKQALPLAHVVPSEEVERLCRGGRPPQSAVTSCHLTSTQPSAPPTAAQGAGRLGSQELVHVLPEGHVHWRTGREETVSTHSEVQVLYFDL